MTVKKNVKMSKSKPKKPLTKEDASLITKSKGNKAKSNSIPLPGGRAKSANRSREELELKVRGRTAEPEAKNLTLTRAEQSLQKEKGILQAMLNNARNSHLVYLDRDFNFVRVNEAYANTCGFPPEEMIGRNYFDLYPHEENRAIFARVRDTGIPAEFHDRPFSFPDQPERGVTYWDWTLTPVKDDSGTVVGLVFSLFETTERKKAEEALKQSEERYRSIFEGANDGIIACDLMTGKFLFANAKMSSLLGYSAEEIYELGIKDIHPAKDLPYVLEEFHRMAEGKITETRAIPVMKKSGGIVYCDIGSSFLGKRILIGFFRDITARRAAEEQIKDLNEQLKRQVSELDAANKELDSFAYSISHDLRAPLRHISGFIKILVEDYSDRLDVQGRDYLDRVYNSSEKMGKLIEDLLYLSRISRQECDRIDFSLSMKASSVIEGLSASHPDRKVEVSIKEGLVAVADPALTEIVLSNLLGNAWKFTSKTENARIEFGALDQDGQTVYFVRDNGAGFEPDNKNKLFVPFQRLHSDKDFEGLGIGLSIAARIIRRHGGRIWAEGEKGKGATFFFTLN